MEQQPQANNVVADAASQVKPKATRTRKPKVQPVSQPSEQPAAQPAEQAVVQAGDANVAGSSQPAEEKASRKKPAKTAAVQFDFVGHAMRRYVDGGWNTFKSQPGSINDFVAYRGTKAHFVRVVPSSSAEDSRYTGESKNSFIQNALSNNATPVFAKVKPVAKKGDVIPSGADVTFNNINGGARVIVGATK